MPGIPRIIREAIKKTTKIHGTAVGTGAADRFIEAAKPLADQVNIGFLVYKAGRRTWTSFERSQSGFSNASFVMSTTSAGLAIAALTCKTGSIVFTFIRCELYSAGLYQAAVFFSAASDKAARVTEIDSIFG